MTRGPPAHETHSRRATEPPQNNGRCHSMSSIAHRREAAATRTRAPSTQWLSDDCVRTILLDSRFPSTRLWRWAGQSNRWNLTTKRKPTNPRLPGKLRHDQRRCPCATGPSSIPQRGVRPVISTRVRPVSNATTQCPPTVTLNRAGRAPSKAPSPRGRRPLWRPPRIRIDR